MKEQVSIFGCGKFFRENQEKIAEKYDILHIFDNYAKEKVYQGIKIETLSELTVTADTKIVIMVKNFFDIVQQLLAMGIKEENLILGINEFGETDREKIIRENAPIILKNGKSLIRTADGAVREVSDKAELDVIWQEILRAAYAEDTWIRQIKRLPARPVTRDFGTGRGTAVDRVFIERFLDKNKAEIHGDVLEIGDNAYTLKYGRKGEYTSHILHVWGWGANVIKGNLETGEGLREEMFDTMILTQTLMFIFDLNKTAANIYKALKQNGVALITVAGLSQISRYDADRWGSYWGLHEHAIKNLFIPYFGEENVEIEVFGNVKLVCAMMYGLCYEELSEGDFDVVDVDYPLIYTVKVRK